MQAQFLLGFVAHHRNVNLGVAQIVGDVHVGHRNVANPRIAKLGKDRHADYFADGGGGFQCAA